MSILSIDDLLGVLQKSRLVPDEQFQLAIDTVRSQASAPEGLHKLCELGIITSWQSERLLAGFVTFTVDRYKLMEQIGQGGMGAVFKAEHTVMGRMVALKVLSNARLQNSAAVQRFRREVKAAAALDHPNIITAHDAGEVAGIHYLVMEYVAGADLNAWTKAHGLLPTVWAAEFARQAALGLEHARKLSMVHRDIKPGNILVSWEDFQKQPTVKILDLGLARFIREGEQQTRNDKNSSASGMNLMNDLPPDRTAAPGSTMDENLTQFGQVLGTPDYLAPEQIQRTHDVDIRADIFSLGCTLFKILTGQLPFGGTTVWEKLEARTNPSAPPAVLLRSLRPDAPAGLEAIVARMLARDPDARFQTPGELAVELEPYAWAASLAASRDSGEFDPGEQRFLGIGPGASSPSAPSSMSMIFVRRASEDDSGTRAFLGALAGEAEPTPATMSAPPVAPVRMAAVPLAGVPAAGVPMPSPRPLPQFIKTGHEETVGDAEWAGPRGDNAGPGRPTPNHLMFKGPGESGVLPTVRVSERRSGRSPSELDARREQLLRRRQQMSVMPVLIAGLVAVGVVGFGLWMASQGNSAPPLRPIDTAKAEIKKPATPVVDTGKHAHSRTDDWKNLPQWHPESSHPEKPGEKTGERSTDKKERPRGEESLKPDDEKKEPKETPRAAPEVPAKTPPRTGPATPPRAAWRPQPIDPLLELILEGHTREVTSVAISPDGRTALSGSLDHTVRLWDLATGEELQVFEGHEDGVTVVAYMSGGSRACSASRDMTVRIWDLAKPRQAYLLKGHTAPVTQLSTSGDASASLVTGGEDAVRVWNIASGTNRSTDHLGENLVAVRYTTTGPRAFYGSGTEPLRCYNVVTLEEAFHIRGAPLVNTVAMSRDLRLLAEGQAMGVISILDVKQQGSDALNYRAHEGGVLSVAFTLDSEFVVSGGMDKNVLVHKIDGTQHVTLRGHTGPVTSVFLSRDGSWILSGSHDKTLRLWQFPAVKSPPDTD